MRPLVSVNITTYNRAHLFPRCIDSVLSQSYPNLEVVVVDDASEDSTPELVSSYQSKDKRIKYHRHESNKGNAFARNTAWRNSSGLYIAFMDDDDEWIDPHKLEKQVEHFESYKEHSFLAIACSSVRLHFDEVQYTDKVISMPTNLIKKILSGNGMIYSPTVMTPKSVLEEVGGFDLKLSRGVDSDFYRNCLVRHGYDVYFMPDVTTAIYEYGDDRMTPVKTLSEANKIMKNNFHVIWKYLFGFLVHPSALVKRVRMVLISYKKTFL